MATTHESVDSETIPNHTGDFGANEWLVEEMYERYLADPNAVDAAWHDFFADYARRPPTPTRTLEPAGARSDGRAPRHRHRPRRQRRRRPRRRRLRASPVARRTAAPRAGGRAPARPTRRRQLQWPRRPPTTASAIRRRLRGAAARVVVNMEASLTVPTATSVRAVPAKLLADNRVVINNHLRRARGGKVSFTHLVGYAVVKAVLAHPEMNNHFAEVDGKPALVAARARQPRHRDRPGRQGRRPLAGRRRRSRTPRRMTSPSSGAPTKTSSGGPAPAS